MANEELEPYRAEFTAFCEHMEVGLKTRFPSLTQKEVLAVIGISLFAETQKLQRDNAALMEDAARYRWLRDVHIGDDPEAIELTSARTYGLDAAIDAAMSKEHHATHRMDRPVRRDVRRGNQRCKGAAQTNEAEGLRSDAGNRAGGRDVPQLCAQASAR